MHCNYADIVAKCGVPVWWDEHAVPRYCAFAPEQLADIYATEAALALIVCQGCGHEYDVAFSMSGGRRAELHRIAQAAGAQTWPRSLADEIKDKSLHYGDPPNYPIPGCCPAGATMNSIPIRVIEYWHRPRGSVNWTRERRLEVMIEPDWTKEAAS